MKTFTKGRDQIIQRIGLMGGMPVLQLETGEPAILKPEEDEKSLQRVGWAEFFKACEDRGYVFVYDDDPGATWYAFLPANRAQKELGPQASHGWRHTIQQLKQLPAIQAH